MKRWVLALVAVSLLGCGGGGGGSPSSGTTTSKSYKLNLTGTFAAGAVGGVQFDLTLPASVTIKTQVDSSTSAVVASDSSFFLSGSIPSSAIKTTKYASGVLSIAAIASPTGFSAGEFATIVCDVTTGATAPAASEFVISNVKIIDANSATIAGATVTAN